MYNQAAYNRQPYNRAGAAESWAAAAARLRTAAAGSMTAELSLRGRADARLFGAASATWEKPLRGDGAALRLNGTSPMLKTEVPFAAARAALRLAGGSAPLSLYSSDDLTLEGLQFAPGDELVIDTDRVTVEQNGVSVIRCWRAGSVPLRLAPGDNVLIWQDGETARTVSCTVVWKDRWI